MQFIPLTYGTPLLSMSEDFYRWQCHVETQDIILDFITNYHLFQILIFQQDMLTFYGHKENYNLISPPGCSPSYCTVARAAPHLAPFSQTGDVLTASGVHNHILAYSFIKSHNQYHISFLRSNSAFHVFRGAFLFLPMRGGVSNFSRRHLRLCWDCARWLLSLIWLWWCCWSCWRRRMK